MLSEFRAFLVHLALLSGGAGGPFALDDTPRSVHHRCGSAPVRPGFGRPQAPHHDADEVGDVTSSLSVRPDRLADRVGKVLFHRTAEKILDLSG